MADLIASGRIVDLILALVFVEVVVVAIIRARTGGGIAIPDFLSSVAPGVALLLALRAAATGSGWIQTAAWLAAALAAHLVDLARRWKS